MSSAIWVYSNSLTSQKWGPPILFSWNVIGAIFFLVKRDLSFYLFVFRDRPSPDNFYVHVKAVLELSVTRERTFQLNVIRELYCFVWINSKVFAVILALWRMACFIQLTLRHLLCLMIFDRQLKFDLCLRAVRMSPLWYEWHGILLQWKFWLTWPLTPLITDKG